VTQPVAEALTRFARVSGAPLATLEGELAFLLGAARLVATLRAEGYALCRPTIAPPAARLILVEQLYSLELALRLRERPPANGVPHAPVPNDVAFDEAGRIQLITAKLPTPALWARPLSWPRPGCRCPRSGPS
jgi:hypothetical protein